MRYKNLLKLTILAVILIVIIHSCQKFDKVEDTNMTDQNNNKAVGLKDSNFSPEFNWETTQIITLNISSTNSQILNITSTDQLIRYYKGMHPGNSQAYTIKISVPTNVDKLILNNQEINLNSNTLSISL